MNKMKYLKLINPVFLILIVLIPSVTGSIFHWSLLAAAVVVALVNSVMIYKMTESYEALYRFSYFDSLTRIPNRLSTDLYCSRVHSVEQLSVAVMDLDNLKKTNDRYGHLTGDELLIRFASILARCAGPDGFAARNGGDEFIVFFHGEDACRMMREFRDRLEEEIGAARLNNGSGICYSLGSACGPSDKCRDIRALVSLADERMYCQKREKKRSCSCGKEAAEND